MALSERVAEDVGIPLHEAGDLDDFLGAIAAAISLELDGEST